MKSCQMVRCEAVEHISGNTSSSVRLSPASRRLIRLLNWKCVVKYGCAFGRDCWHCSALAQPCEKWAFEAHLKHSSGTAVVRLSTVVRMNDSSSGVQAGAPQPGQATKRLSFILKLADTMVWGRSEGYTKGSGCGRRPLRDSTDWSRRPAVEMWSAKQVKRDSESESVKPVKLHESCQCFMHQPPFPQLHSTMRSLHQLRAPRSRCQRFWHRPTASRVHVHRYIWSILLLVAPVTRSFSPGWAMSVTDSDLVDLSMSWLAP